MGVRRGHPDVTTGLQTHKLLASNTHAFQTFGYHVALFGDRALAVATKEAYLFDVYTGQELVRITHPKTGNVFRAADMSESFIVITDPDDDTLGLRAGAAWVFDSTGTLLHKLTASDGPERDFFGMSVDVHGDRAVIGAYNPSVYDTEFVGGAAYVFDLNTGHQLFQFASPQEDGTFGFSVAMSESQVLGRARRLARASAGWHSATR